MHVCVHIYMHAHSEHYGRHPLLMYWSLILYMGRLRLVGSLKLNVSFAKYSLFYRALLQTRPVTLRSLLIVATPYTFPVLVSFDSSVSLSTRFLCRSLVVQLGLFEHVSCVSLFSYISSLFCYFSRFFWYVSCLQSSISLHVQRVP